MACAPDSPASGGTVTVLYTAKGVASIIGGWFGAFLYEQSGSWAMGFYGSALMADRRYDEAEIALTRGLDLAPQDERAMNLLGAIATIRSVERNGGGR